MKLQTVNSSELSDFSRLDAYFHLSEGHRINRALRQHPRLRNIVAGDGLGADVSMPARLKQFSAAQNEEVMPYLRPSDTLNYLPRASAFLSMSRTKSAHDCKVIKGTLLVTRSGRNLGPVVYVDSFLSRFVVSDDMVRVFVPEETFRHYLLGFFGTRYGQHLLRKDKSGSVIDHITVDHVASLDVPMLADELVEEIASEIKRAVSLREAARLGMAELQRQYESELPDPPQASPIARGWTISAQDLGSRLDAAPYETSIREVRSALLDGGGQRLSEVADALKPTGRYKTIYVDEENGVPILSGGQLHQIRPLNPKFMAPRALRDIARYRLKKRWIAYQADGRAEEGLGEPALIIGKRDGWLASGHVGRLIAKDGISAGSLYLAFKTPHAQSQLKALASGSVVDATFPADAESVVLPRLDSEAGTKAEKFWMNFEDAEKIEDAVYASIERAITV